MSDPALIDLAEHAGIATGWRDVFGAWHHVSPETLRAMLAALDLPAATATEIAASRAALVADPGPAPLAIGLVGEALALAGAAGRYRLTLESGLILDGTLEAGAMLPAIAEPGYHTLEIGARSQALAIAPPACVTVDEKLPSGRGFGFSAQLYSLRRAGDGGVGDFAALASLGARAGAAGADLLAISPVHAQFSADPARFAPYSPSSRTHLNILHAVPPLPLPASLAAEAAALEAMPLIDWPRAGRLRLDWLRAAYAALAGPLADRFAAFRAAAGPDLRRHAIFEALHADFRARSPDLWHWRSWPAAFQDPASAAVAEFARARAHEVDFHLFGQFLAERGLADAQAACLAGGMRIGLVTDLAVGADGAGSAAWASPREMLRGLSIGAPPDLLNLSGQDWGLTGFSPTGLCQSGYAAFIAMLRAALRHAGGVRIDHVMGLARLWLLPEGASPDQGAYLRYPLTDLLRLVALESHRAGALVLGEDLGTLPDGFQHRLDSQALLGLRVLWFEQHDGAFRPPADWTHDAVAVTSTHDLPTLRGWWTGQDLAVRESLGLLGDPTGIYYAQETRARERGALWHALCRSGAAAGAMPDPADWPPFLAAAIRHLALAGCHLALLPLEDLCALPDQPNLPGTITGHPNWRRRLPADCATLFTDPQIRARIGFLRR